jgi:membrane protein implicated in regulation of membrane protease activity
MYESFWVWLTFALLFVLAEIGHPTLFFFLAFALGACFTAGFSLIVSSLEGQVGLFLVSTMVCMYGLKKWFSFPRGGEKVTNSAALLGRRVVVTSDITPDTPGTVTFDGSVWTAHTQHDIFVKGDRVMIHAVKGAHVIVRSIIKT